MTPASTIARSSTCCGAPASAPAADELDLFRAMSVRRRSTRCVDYEQIPDDVDSKIGQPGYVGTTTRGALLAADRTSPTRASAGCSGWCTPTGRCRRR